jgi:hypothetical protein
MTGAARAAAECYIVAVNARDGAGLRELFDDSVVALNTAGEYHGREKVVGFYEQLVFANEVVVVPTHVYEAGDTCVVELEGRSPNSADVFRMIDVFTVGGNGRVTRLAIYRR